MRKVEYIKIGTFPLFNSYTLNSEMGLYSAIVNYLISQNDTVIFNPSIKYNSIILQISLFFNVIVFLINKIQKLHVIK